MAQDDIHIIIYKLLAYLYDCMKKGKRPEPAMLESDGPVFGGVPERYRCAIIAAFHNLDYQPLGTKKGNPDLIVNGEYVDIKTPEQENRIARRINQGSIQCRNRGQKKGIVLLSPLRLGKGFEGMAITAKSRIEQGYVDEVYVIGPDSTVTKLTKTSG